MINLFQAPVYLASALTVWKWPCFAESIAGLTLIAIWVKLIPPAVPPYDKYLSWEFAFIIGANMAFVAAVALRRTSANNLTTDM